MDCYNINLTNQKKSSCQLHKNTLSHWLAWPFPLNLKQKRSLSLSFFQNRKCSLKNKGTSTNNPSTFIGNASSALKSQLLPPLSSTKFRNLAKRLYLKKWRYQWRISTHSKNRQLCSKVRQRGSLWPGKDGFTQIHLRISNPNIPIGTTLSSTFPLTIKTLVTSMRIYLTLLNFIRNRVQPKAQELL